MFGAPYGTGPFGSWQIFSFGGVASVKHVVEIYNPVTSERVVFYNDNSDISGGMHTGRGYIFAKVYNNMEVEVSGSPFQVSTTVLSDDCSFGAAYLSDSPQCIQLVIAVLGVPTRFQSSDYCRTFKML